MNPLRRTVAALVPPLTLLALPGPITAAEPLLSAKVAMKIVEGCMAHAQARRKSHAIAVYDLSGQPVAVLRMDGSSAGATEFAMQKAAAVAHWGFSTADMEAAAREAPGFGKAPRVVTIAGGIPVYSADGSKFIGAVGASGEAPDEDAACALAGIAAANLSPAGRPAG